MLNENLPEKIKQSLTVNDSEIEFCLYNTRGRSGARCWEIKLLNDDGTRSIVVVRDFGVNIIKKVVEVNLFNNRIERNREIYRLYHEQGLSQVFLANLFNISQPSVSFIVNGRGLTEKE